ncbi:hypothetical protein CPAR01_09517, partial [Colletotrichum paranaense]
HLLFEPLAYRTPACRSVLLLGQPFVPELLRGPQLEQGCHSCGGGFAEAKHQH